jgi:arabinogalactan endo-1,4-beta-galactosidase
MRSKNGVLLPVVFLAVVVLVSPLDALTAISPGLSAALSATETYMPPNPDIHVNPINGLSADFIMGAHVSMLKQIDGGAFGFGAER